MRGAWILVAAAGLGVVILSIWGGRVARTSLAYFAASRKAGAVLAGLGGTAAGLSAFVFIGGPGLFASIGVASLWLILSAPLTGALQCWVVGEPIVSLAERHRCITVPDLLAARFGNGFPRGLAAVAIVAGGVATLAVQVKGVAVLGEVVFSLPGWVLAGSLVMATTAYTTAGGMRAGLVAEAFQGVLMGGIAVVLAGVALARAGGPAAALHTLQVHRPELLSAWGSIGPVTALSLFLLFGLGTCAQPHYLQKFLLLKGHAALRWMPAVMTLSLLSVLTVWLGLGLGGTALAIQGRLSLSTPDSVTPAFIGSLAPWLMVAALTAVTAAVMSTAATLLNLVAGALSHDLPLAIGRTPSSKLTTARWCTLLAAAAALVLGLVSHRSVAFLGVLGWGTFTAALLPSVVLGLNWSGASRRGAIAAMATGPVIQLCLEAFHAHGRMLSWEPGLTGAAVGTILLVLLSPAPRTSQAPSPSDEAERPSRNTKPSESADLRTARRAVARRVTTRYALSGDSG
ncbi:MAG: hypothetical protein GXP48_02520 [Acidobacteria bacterium]|nr:hypothetical protein [Acidobacteriota bacterium]